MIAKNSIKHNFMRIVITFIFIIILLISPGVVFSEENSVVFSEGFIDITSSEAFNMLDNLDDGLQIPIDVRTQSEYFNERINSSFPEDPRNHCICGWSNQKTINEFMSKYEGEEIILYCYSGGRSSQAAQMLVDNNFDGTIYNMLGGISDWKSNGFPTIIQNKVPEIPVISGPVDCITKDNYTYYAQAYDPDLEALRYGWDFNSDQNVDLWSDFNKSGVEINISHIWNLKGTHFISVIAEDRIGDKSSSWAILEVNVLSYDQNKPDVEIIKPISALYFKDKEIFSFLKPVVFGDINIFVESSDVGSGIDYVELYINDEKVFNSTIQDFEYLWNKKSFGRYQIKAIAYDKEQNIKETEIDVYRFF